MPHYLLGAVLILAGFGLSAAASRRPTSTWTTTLAGSLVGCGVGLVAWGLWDRFPLR
jgi:hypothetical protein